MSMSNYVTFFSFCVLRVVFGDETSSNRRRNDVEKVDRGVDVVILWMEGTCGRA